MASASEKEFIQGLSQRTLDSSKLTIFMVGNVGSGKSTLVNSLLGEKAAETGASLETVTKEVGDFDGLVCVQRPIGYVTTTIWDSPGLQDPDVDKEILLKKLSDKCSNVDLVVYCIPMTKIRLDYGEVASIRDITKALGVSVWKRALFVLTFANQLELPKQHNEGCHLQEYFYQRKEEWSQLLHNKLESAGVVRAIAHEVPVIAAGYDKEPLSYLLENDDWYLGFWSTCCERVACDAFPAFLTIYFQIEKYATNSKFVHNFFSSTKFRKKVEGCTDTSLFLGFVKAWMAEFNRDYSDLAKLWLKVGFHLFTVQQKGAAQKTPSSVEPQ